MVDDCCEGSKPLLVVLNGCKSYLFAQGRKVVNKVYMYICRISTLLLIIALNFLPPFIKVVVLLIAIKRKFDMKKFGLEKDNECNGRSMIEMLGVLAIIGVLSVGGIAGYSKAMEKFKLNKTISEYSYMLLGLVEHLDDLGRNSYHKGSGYFSEVLVDYVQGLNLVPVTWSKVSDLAMSDSDGNIVQCYKHVGNSKMLLVDFYLGGWKTTDKGNISANFSPKLCIEMFNIVMIPLHSAVYSVNTYNSKKGDVTFYGDAYCSEGRMCLSNATLAQIKSACEHCDATGVCSITIRFPL